MTRLALRFAQSAEDELDDTWLFVARNDGPERADSLIMRLRETGHKLCRMPGLGKPWPERPNTRAFSALSFVFLYRIDGDELTILHVVHGARDLGPIFAGGGD